MSQSSQSQQSSTGLWRPLILQTLFIFLLQLIKNIDNIFSKTLGDALLTTFWYLPYSTGIENE